MAAKFKDILPFTAEGDDSNVSLAWVNWVENFELMLGARDLTKPSVKKDTLLFIGGKFIRDVWKSLPQSKITFTPSEIQEEESAPESPEITALVSSLQELRDASNVAQQQAAAEGSPAAIKAFAATSTRVVARASTLLLGVRAAVLAAAPPRAMPAPQPKDEYQ